VIERRLRLLLAFEHTKVPVQTLLSQRVEVGVEK
jgi:hypothetical protein